MSRFYHAATVGFASVALFTLGIVFGHPEQPGSRALGQELPKEEEQRPTVTTITPRPARPAARVEQRVSLLAAQLTVNDHGVQSGCRVYSVGIEVENLSGCAAAVHLDPKNLKLELLDADGKVIAEGASVRSGPAPIAHDATIPTSGYVGFSTYRGGIALSPESVLFAAGIQDWTLKPGTHRLRGSVTVSAKFGGNILDPLKPDVTRVQRDVQTIKMELTECRFNARGPDGAADRANEPADLPKREPAGGTPAGTLTGRFVFDGEVPAAKDLAPELTKIDAARPQIPGPDGRFSGVEAVYREFLGHGIRPKTDDPTLLVGKDGGVANVVVWVASKDIPWTPPKEQRPVTIRLKDGNYAPRVSVAAAGQPVLVENHDPVRFNLHLTPARNDETNVWLAARSPKNPLRLTFPKAETVPTSYRSDQGPWATGWLFVHATPFVAVSRADGSFALPDLPPGEWEFRVWHERPGYLRHWPKGVFKHTVKPGENNLGVIKLKPEHFTR